MTGVFAASLDVFRAQYEVSRDGAKFLMNTVLNESVRTPISLILNFGVAYPTDPRAIR